MKFGLLKKLFTKSTPRKLETRTKLRSCEAIGSGTFLPARGGRVWKRNPKGCLFQTYSTLVTRSHSLTLFCLFRNVIFIPSLGREYPGHPFRFVREYPGHISISPYGRKFYFCTCMTSTAIMNTLGCCV